MEAGIDVFHIIRKNTIGDEREITKKIENKSAFQELMPGKTAGPIIGSDEQLSDRREQLASTPIILHMGRCKICRKTRRWERKWGRREEVSHREEI